MKLNRLTPEKLSQLKSNEWVDGRWYYNPYEIIDSQRQSDLKQALEWMIEKLVIVREYSDCYTTAMGKMDYLIQSLKDQLEEVKK